MFILPAFIPLFAKAAITVTATTTATVSASEITAFGIATATVIKAIKGTKKKKEKS